MIDITNIIDVVDDVTERFNSQLGSTEKKLLDEVLNLVKGLSVTNGRINSSVDNLKLLTKIKSKLKQVILNKDYLKSVKELISGMDKILTVQISYFNKDFHVSKDFKGKSELVKQLAIENTVNMLAGTGIEANVTNKINEMLLRSITSGGRYADLVQEMSDFLTTSENGDGALSRYAQTWTNTSLNQFAGQNNKLMTDDLGLEWYVYVGSNKDTTREFCEVLKEKKYIHKSEIPDIVKGKIDGHQCEIYERTGLPKGMIAGTTAENFMVNCGGWNCGHKLVPVSEVAVPEHIIKKIEMKSHLPYVVDDYIINEKSYINNEHVDDIIKRKVNITEHEGVKIVEPVDLDKTKQFITVEDIKKELTNLPEFLKKGIKEVRLVDYASTYDDYYKKKYNNPNHKTFASDGDKITFYKNTKDVINVNLRNVMVHEAGHYLDIKLGYVSGLERYSKCMLDDQAYLKMHHKYISSYARQSQSNAEDFADSIVRYMQLGYESFKTLYPNRAEYIHEIEMSFK